MRSRSTLRSLSLAVILLTAALDARAKNLGEWTADLLRDVVQGYSPEKGTDGKYHILVLHPTDSAKFPEADLAHPEVAPSQEKASDDRLEDVYVQLQRAFASERFQCVILNELQPQQIIAAEQFARDFAETQGSGVVLVSVVFRKPERGRIPFAFDPDGQVGFARMHALGAYQLKLRSMKLERPLVPLDRDPAYQDLDQCKPLDPKDRGANPEVICHHNAFANIDSPNYGLQNGILDLEVAVLHVFDEEFDHRVYPRGWGREGYHPHVGLADYLSRSGACAAAGRELKRAKHANSKAKEETEARINRQCTSVALHVPGNGIPAEARWSLLAVRAPGVVESELLPPLRPSLVWGHVAPFR